MSKSFWTYDTHAFEPGDTAIYQVNGYESINKGWWIVDGFEFCVQIGNGIYETREQAVKACLASLNEEREEITGTITKIDVLAANLLKSLVE